MPKRELYFENGELYHGDPGGTDMRPIATSDLDTATTTLNAAAAAAAAASTDGVYDYTAQTASADGSTSTIISTASRVVVPVTSADANHIVYLPTIGVLGQEVCLTVGATGYELRPADANSINGGTPGAGAESAIGANIITTCVAATATNWVCMNQTAAGVVAATDASAV